MLLSPQVGVERWASQKGLTGTAYLAKVGDKQFPNPLLNSLPIDAIWLLKLLLLRLLALRLLLCSKLYPFPISNS